MQPSSVPVPPISRFLRRSVLPEIKSSRGILGRRSNTLDASLDDILARRHDTRGRAASASFGTQASELEIEADGKVS